MTFAPTVLKKKTQKKPHSCKNLVDLRKHLDTHSSESAFHCDVPGCGFTSRAACTMKIHHKREHEVMFEVFV